MHLNVAKEVAALQRLTIGELRRRYAEAFGEQPTYGPTPRGSRWPSRRRSGRR
jgi:hypothetical protein